MKTQLCIGVLLAILITFLPTEKAFPNAALRWDDSALRATRDAKLGTPMASRALAVVRTCMYDVWAAYNEKAVGTQLSGALRRPLAERTLANKEKAIIYAAYRALSDVLPSDTESVYEPLLQTVRELVKAEKRNALILMTLCSPFMCAGHCATAREGALYLAAKRDRPLRMRVLRFNNEWAAK